MATIRSRRSGPAGDLIQDGLPEAALASQRLKVRRVGLLLAVFWLVGLVLAALLADVLPLASPLATDARASRTGPSFTHWLGADQLGRDLLSRVLHGARSSLFIGVAATAVAAIIGSVIGMLAGYFGRWAESAAMGAMDVLLAFPSLVLALALTAFLGASVRNVMIAIAVLAVPAFARVVRAQTLSLASRDFIRAARTVGASHSRILSRELAPNLISTVLAFATVVIAIAILVEGALSFLGIGVPPPTPSWGEMIASGRGDLARAPHISMMPAGIMFLTILALNVVAEHMQGKSDVVVEAPR